MLKRAIKNKDNWQHCCRWCHYFSNGECHNEDMSSAFEFNNNSDIYQVAEQGHLSEVLQEVLDESPPLKGYKELKHLLRDFKVSEKRIKEFINLFIKCHEEYSIDLKERLDEKVSILYQNWSSGIKGELSGIKISDPENHYCKYWR